MTNNYQVNYSKYGTHQIISRLLNDRQTILDVGCNDGYLKKLHKRGVFTGLDYSSQSLNKAKKLGYKSVKKCDLNLYAKIELREKFDTIVFGDVLEHLLFPEKVLKYFIDKNLAKNGSVIVSLPNVANFTTRLGLLFGNFEYVDSGILDRTHLHLYTTNTAEKLLADSGLVVIQRKYSSNNFGFIIDKLPFLGGLLGYNLIFLCQKK